MHFPVEGTRKTLLFLTVLTSWIIGFGEMAGDKTLNLRIGFDLTQGTNGAPALRIRDFEGSEGSENERHPRATDKEDEEEEKEEKEEKEDMDKPAIRADSFSDEDTKGKQVASSREDDAQSSDGSDNDSGGNHRSTKGLQPGEYEPEDNPKIHGRYDEENDDSDENSRRRRKKRELDYEPMKRKSKKFRSARKQGVSRA